MSGFRTIRDAARLALHDALSYPALYLMGSRPAVRCDVRINSTFVKFGDVKGTGFAYAERQDVSPTITFLSAGFTPERGALVTLSQDEAYRIDNILPVENVTISAESHRLNKAEAFGLPYPSL